MSLRTLINGWLEGERTSPPPRPAPVEWDPESAPQHEYFTDGANLYRFVGWTGRSVTPGLAELEDCRSLDILLVGPDMLERGPLRRISLPS